MRPVRTTVALTVTLSTLALGGLTTSASAASTAPYTAKGSIEEAYVLGAQQGDKLSLVNKQGKVTGKGTADRFGSLVFRDLAPGSGYTIRQPLDDGVAGSTGMKVLALDEHPPTSFYEEQEPLVDGYQYLTTRDGTTLSITDCMMPSGPPVRTARS